MVHLLAVGRKRGYNNLPHKLSTLDGELFGHLGQQLEVFFRNVNERSHKASKDI
jgi:hypothetical protein